MTYEEKVPYFVKKGSLIVKVVFFCAFNLVSRDVSKFSC